MLVIHLKYSSVYMSLPNSLIIPSPYPSPLQSCRFHSLNLWVCSCVVYRFICIISFQILHIKDIIWYFSFCIWLHSACQSLGPRMSLQTTLFHSFSWLRSIPLYICTTSLSIHLSMDTGVARFEFLFCHLTVMWLWAICINSCCLVFTWKMKEIKYWCISHQKVWGLSSYTENY